MYVCLGENHHKNGCLKNYVNALVDNNIAYHNYYNYVLSDMTVHKSTKFNVLLRVLDVFIDGDLRII